MQFCWCNYLFLAFVRFFFFLPVFCPRLSLRQCTLFFHIYLSQKNTREKKEVIFSRKYISIVRRDLTWTLTNERIEMSMSHIQMTDFLDGFMTFFVTRTINLWIPPTISHMRQLHFLLKYQDKCTCTYVLRLNLNEWKFKHAITPWTRFIFLAYLRRKKTIVFVSRCVRCLENELFESPSIVVFSFLLSFSSLLCLTTYMYASISRSSVKIDI